MKGVLFGCMFFLCAGLATGAEDPVYFADPNLKRAVESELGISDPTPADMLGLISLHAVSYGITDLTGLEYATNMQTLGLRANMVQDLSPLANLTSLEKLNLSNNRIWSISALAGLVNLRSLDLHDNRDISSISALSGLTQLEVLVLRDQKVSNISVLAELSHLRDIDLFGNRIRDISPLSGLTALEHLDLRGNPLNEEACDTYAPQIQANNPGISLLYNPCGSCRLSISSTAGGSVISPGQGEFLYTLGEVIRLEAKANPGFVFTGWSGSYGSGENPTYLQLSRNENITAHFLRTSETLYVDDDAPGDPGPRDSLRSDPLESGTLEHPFDSIAEAMEVAPEGASILVRPGTYRENVDFSGKSLHVMGGDPNVVPCAVINGTGSGPVVRFAGNGPDSVLQGFVITGGQGQPGAALCCVEAAPAVTNCLIVGNRASQANGAAVHCVNSAAVLTNCTIADNWAGQGGAAVTLVDSDVIMTNCLLWGNSPGEILALGTSCPSLRYCDVAAARPEESNLASDPLFARRGYWASAGDPNVVLSPEDDETAWTAGDYHLKSQSGRWDPEAQTWVRDDVTSPCIDRGDRSLPVGSEPAPNGGIVNLGAYGGTSEASKSHAETAFP